MGTSWFRGVIDRLGDGEDLLTAEAESVHFAAVRDSGRDDLLFTATAGPLTVAFDVVLHAGHLLDGDTGVVRISVTGRLTIANDGAFLRERDVPGNQGRLALTMLIVEHRHPVSRDQLAEELWPDGLPRSWETALRAVISKARAAIAQAGLDPQMIGSAGGCYQARLAGASTDFEAAVTALHTAEDQLRRGEFLAAAVSATVTAIVCRRPLLRGLYNPWTVEQRERLHDLHVTARQILAEAHAAVGDWAASAQHAQRGVELDPYREALHQHLILARGRTGDRIGAAHVFHRYRALMRDEFGVEPTRQTVAIFDEALSQV